MGKTAQTDAPAETVSTDTAAADTPAHPAHRLLDEAGEKLNAMGSYAVTQIQPLLDQIRSAL